MSPLVAIAILFAGMGIALSMAPGAARTIMQKTSLGTAWRSRAGQKLQGKMAGITQRRINAFPKGMEKLFLCLCITQQLLCIMGAKKIH